MAGYKLVAVEYVTFAEAGRPPCSATPGCSARTCVPGVGNRYGLPDFYARHAWIWHGNPAGMFADWNPNITCLGNGDNGG